MHTDSITYSDSDDLLYLRRLNDPYEIVPYRREYKRQVAALQIHLWSKNAELAADYFQWKYEQNPYCAEPFLYLAFEGNELVGMRGFYGAKWEFGRPREVRTVLVADDFVIEPEHRNRGLATLIMKAAVQELATSGYTHVFNLSGGRVTVLTSLAMGWKSAGPLDPVASPAVPTWQSRLQNILKRAPLTSRLAGASLPGLIDEIRPFAHFDRAAQSAAKGRVRLALEPEPEAMAELVRKLGHDGRIRHVRDREYFAWRFRNPLCDYRFVYLGDSPLEGYLVLRAASPESVESKRVKIVDLEAEKFEQQKLLLETAMKSVHSGDLFAWAGTFPAETRQALSWNGFVPTDLESRAHGCPTVLVKPVTLAPTDRSWTMGDLRLTNLANWDMRMLYTMAG